MCQKYQNDNPQEPVVVQDVPGRLSSLWGRPWETVASDIVQLHGSFYLIIADVFSGFFEFSKIPSIQSDMIISLLKTWFAVHGIPDVLLTDNRNIIETIQKIPKHLEF